MRHLHADVARALLNHPHALTRFWDSVDRTGSAADCWKWRNPPSRGGYPMFRVKQHSVSAARVAWLTATGEFPLGGRMRHTCDNATCMRPEHLVWELGRTAERVLRSKADGYVSVADICSVGRSHPSDEAGSLSRYHRRSA